jgi:hypothetical protein
MLCSHKHEWCHSTVHSTITDASICNSLHACSCSQPDAAAKNSIYINKTQIFSKELAVVSTSLRKLINTITLPTYTYTYKHKPNHAMAQTINSRPLTTDAQVLSKAEHVRFVVEKATLGQIFLWVLQLSLITIITLILTHTYFIHLPLSS